VSAKENGFVNKETLLRKCTGISNGIPITITQHSNYHEDTLFILVSFVKRIMELTKLICSY
jgi:hypothetical protein